MLRFGGTATVDTRYTFVPQFLKGAAAFAKGARQIEQAHSEAAPADDQQQMLHLAQVSAAVMQSAAALEAEISELLDHGPGHQLGSNGIDATAQQFLTPLAEVIDDQTALDRYQLVLHLLQRPKLDQGGNPFQATALLVRLRNEVTHYKSKLGEQMKREKLFTSLQLLKHARPSFVPASGVNFFPRQCLSADCADWSVRTAVAFIDAFYVNLGTPSPLNAHRATIVGQLAPTAT